MSDPGQLRVLLVRAGPTEWDRDGRVCGSTDLPLCDRAVQATREALAGCPGPRVTTVFTGPEEASRRTAELTAEVAGGRVRVVGDLRDVGLGLWEGLTRSELEERHPRVFAQWRDDPGAVVPPDAEPLDLAESRILGALSRSLRRYRSEASGAAVVLRPTALGLVRCWLDGKPTRELWSVVESQPAAEWRQIPRAAFERATRRVRARS